jgi:hypothetical protein
VEEDAIKDEDEAAVEAEGSRKEEVDQVNLAVQQTTSQ